MTWFRFASAAICRWKCSPINFSQLISVIINNQRSFCMFSSVSMSALLQLFDEFYPLSSTFVRLSRSASNFPDRKWANYLRVLDFDKLFSSPKTPWISSQECKALSLWSQFIQNIFNWHIIGVERGGYTKFFCYTVPYNGHCAKHETPDRLIQITQSVFQYSLWSESFCILYGQRGFLRHNKWKFILILLTYVLSINSQTRKKIFLQKFLANFNSIFMVWSKRHKKSKLYHFM